MAAKGRRHPDNLIETLHDQPYRFEFFQAVRILEQLARRQSRDPRFAAMSPVGEDSEPSREAVRFKAAQALSFPTSEISTVRQPQADTEAKGPAGPTEMTVNFMGLTGPTGVMPQYDTETLIRSMRAKSLSLRDFLDLFNHRTISFIHRAWEKYRLPPSYERGGPGGADPISFALYALIGLGTSQLRNRLRVDDEALLHYSGHFSHRPRSGAALNALLSDYFERPVEVRQFQGRWMYLNTDERSTLPGRDGPEAAFCRLGVNAVVGDRVWDVQSNFRIRLGPLTYAQFVRFMPSGEDLQKMAQLIRLYVGPGLSFDVQITLAKEEVPDCRLAGEGDGVPRLGWNTWIKHREFEHDVDEAVYHFARL